MWRCTNFLCQCVGPPLTTPTYAPVSQGSWWLWTHRSWRTPACHGSTCQRYATRAKWPYEPVLEGRGYVPFWFTLPRKFGTLVHRHSFVYSVLVLNTFLIVFSLLHFAFIQLFSSLQYMSFSLLQDPCKLGGEATPNLGNTTALMNGSHFTAK